MSYRLIDLAKYRKYKRLGDSEGVYIIRSKKGVPAVTRKSAIRMLQYMGPYSHSCIVIMIPVAFGYL